MNKVREYKLRILDGVICALEEKRESFECVGIEWSGYAIRTEIDVSEHPAVITAQHQLTAWVNNLLTVNGKKAHTLEHWLQWHDIPVELYDYSSEQQRRLMRMTRVAWCRWMKEQV